MKGGQGSGNSEAWLPGGEAGLAGSGLSGTVAGFRGPGREGSRKCQQPVGGLCLTPFGSPSLREGWPLLAVMLAEAQPSGAKD